MHRLGANGIQEIKNHLWLRDYNFDDLQKRKLKSPFIPNKSDNFDQKNISEEWKDMDDADFIEHQESLHEVEVQK